MQSTPPLPFGNVRSPQKSGGVPSLQDLSLETLADNADGIVSLYGIAEPLVVALLGKIMQRGRLDYRLACVFRDSGHRDIADAMSSLDLFAAIPTHNALGSRSSLGGRGCR